MILNADYTSPAWSALSGVYEFGIIYSDISFKTYTEVEIRKIQVGNIVVDKAMMPVAIEVDGEIYAFPAICAKCILEKFHNKAIETFKSTIISTLLPQVLITAKSISVTKYLSVNKIVTTNSSKFTAQQVDDYVRLATKNPNAKKVMLGKFDRRGPACYTKRAGKDHTIFDLDQWDEAFAIVNGNTDEMWKINKQFLFNEYSAGKEFYFSHNPHAAVSGEYLYREVEYLLELGITDFIKINENTWKAIR